MMRSKISRRLKLMYTLRIIRNGVPIREIKRKRDLLVWRGQSILAYLLSQGSVGSETSEWWVIVSNNNTMPDMADDSGDPLSNEFNATLGDPELVTCTFEPDQKPSGSYQTYATLTFTGTVNITTTGTVHKLGMIDSNTPHINIVVEDAVIPVDVTAGDQAEVTYFLQMG